MDISLILERRFIGAQWSLNGLNYEDLEWLDESPKPELSELEELWPSVESEFIHSQIENKRAEAYRTESDPLFFKYQRGEATLEDWTASVDAIRLRFPYPEEQV